MCRHKLRHEGPACVTTQLCGRGAGSASHTSGHIPWKQNILVSSRPNIPTLNQSTESTNGPVIDMDLEKHDCFVRLALEVKLKILCLKSYFYCTFTQ